MASHLPAAAEDRRKVSHKHILASLQPAQRDKPEEVRRLDLVALGATHLSSRALAPFVNLSRLDLSGNLLEGKLTIQGAPLLTYLSVAKNPSLTAVDVQACPRLTSLVASLTRLCVDDLDLPRLKVLVVDRCEITGTLTPHCPALETLVCSHNMLEAIDVSPCCYLQKLSASHNAELKAAPDVSACAETLQELRLAHCPAMETLDGVIQVAPQRLALLDLTESPLVTSFELIAPVCQGYLRALNLRDTPLRKSFDSIEAYAQACFEHLPAVTLSLKTLDFKEIPPGTRPNEDAKKLKDAVARKLALQKRNLISDKLNTPDPQAKRNKPCPCGSGIKFKKCCERKDAVKAAPSPAAEADAPPQPVKAKAKPAVVSPVKTFPAVAAASPVPAWKPPVTLSKQPTPKKESTVAKQPNKKQRLAEPESSAPVDEGEVLPRLQKKSSVVVEVVPTELKEDEEDISLLVESIKRNAPADIFSGIGKW